MLAISASAPRLSLESYLSLGTEAGIHWTAIRQAVLHLLWSAATPLGAYEAAERLSKPGRLVHPTSVYRCLRCMVNAGLVLRIVTWNKYLLSPGPRNGLWAVLLCRGCRSFKLIDMSEARAALNCKLNARGFIPNAFAAECEGSCGHCNAGGAAS